jgi:hypothetical protein
MRARQEAAKGERTANRPGIHLAPFGFRLLGDSAHRRARPRIQCTLVRTDAEGESEPAERKRCKEEAEVAERDVIVLRRRVAQQVDDDATEPSGDQEPADPLGVSIETQPST